MLSEGSNLTTYYVRATFQEKKRIHNIFHIKSAISLVLYHRSNQMYSMASLVSLSLGITFKSKRLWV